MIERPERKTLGTYTFIYLLNFLSSVHNMMGKNTNTISCDNALWTVVGVYMKISNIHRK
jgi:hypothetical protein